MQFVCFETGSCSIAHAGKIFVAILLSQSASQVLAFVGVSYHGWLGAVRITVGSVRNLEWSKAELLGNEKRGSRFLPGPWSPGPWTGLLQMPG